MTNLEHYVENAICFLERKGEYKDFFNNPLLKEGEESTGTSLPDMWEIAQYVVYSYRPCIESELNRKLTELYGYEAEE